MKNSRYKNLDRFKEIWIGIKDSISLYYNDNHVIYQESNYPHYIKGFYKRRRLYSRRELIDIGSDGRLGIKFIFL